MSYFLKNRMFPRSRGLLFSLKASVKALTACWYHSSCLVFREVTARNDSILEKVVVLAFFFFFPQVRQVNRLEHGTVALASSPVLLWGGNFFFSELDARDRLTRSDGWMWRTPAKHSLHKKKNNKKLRGMVRKKTRVMNIHEPLISWNDQQLKLYSVTDHCATVTQPYCTMSGVSLGGWDCVNERRVIDWQLLLSLRFHLF